MPAILTIGNSFANNATVFLPQLIAAAPPCPTGTLILGKTNVGGCSLEKHWNMLEQNAIFPDVKPYDFSHTGHPNRPANLREALVAHPWDYVTLQQASPISWQAETFEPALTRLLGLIRELAPQAVPVLHQTWAYRPDSPLYATWGLDLPRMHAAILAANDAAAATHGLRQIPVGAAIHLARPGLAYRHDPAYDFANPRPPALPDQTASLVVGYSWATGNTSDGIPVFNLDPKHLNTLGCYLANAVWYEFFTGHPAAASSFIPPSLTPAHVAIVRAAASAAISEYGGPIATHPGMG